MMSENLSTTSIQSRLDALQGAQVPPTALFGALFDMASVYPTMYPIPGLSRPPLASLPNDTIPPPPSFSADLYSAGGASSVPNYQGQGTIPAPENLPPNSTLPAPPSFSPDMYGAGGPSFVPNYQGRGTISALEGLTPNSTLPAPPSFSPEMYGAGGASFAPNYQVQGTISPPANVTPSMFPVNNVCFLESFYPFAGMLPSDATTGFLQSEDSGRHEQASPLTFQWPLPMQPPATASQQQAQYQVPQEGVAEIEPLREQGSVYKEDYQTNVAFHAAPSAPEVSPQRWEDQPSFQLPVKNTPSKNLRKAQTSTNNRGAEQYYCEPCNKWFPTHKKKKHDKKHDGDYVCRICEILKQPYKPLSRKDALKRHVEKKHPQFRQLLKNLALRILVPRRKNVPEDLEELKQAMSSEP